MSGNTFGKIFKISTFGESHGKAIGVVIDGCPAGLTIHESFIHTELQRRRPGQSSITTQRKETEAFEILSGVFENKTLGTPIAVVIKNADQKSKDYSHIQSSYRPSHADFTYDYKYGIRDYRGGGRSSARETVARVVAGAIAKMFLNENGIAIDAYVSQVGKIKLTEKFENLDLLETEKNIVRCPSPEVATKMIQHIKEIKKEGDTIGGKISCHIQNIPAGLGQPVFDKLHADLAKAMMSINAVKGFEYGSGFDCIEMKGSEHNDIFITEDSKVKTETNFSGGIQGGISNGMPIYFNVAFKPVATIMQDQNSIDKNKNEVNIQGKGRHDPCVVPRAVPIVEAMAALVIADHLLIARSDKL